MSGGSNNCFESNEPKEACYSRLCVHKPDPWENHEFEKLKTLACLMYDSSTRANDDEKRMPSGYVYFGQFVDHDLTRDLSPAAEGTFDETNICNHRTPRLDLDPLYGKEPQHVLYLYDGTG